MRKVPCSCEFIIELTKCEDMGVTMENVRDLSSALKISGLDYEVQKFPIQFMGKQQVTLEGKEVDAIIPFPIEDQFATVRTDKMSFMGIVGKNYEILQNQEMFDFLDDIAGQGGKFETAGSYGTNGAKSFITMSTEPLTILGDEFMPYMNFLNSFDGSGSVKVYFSPVRLFCSNAIIRSIQKSHNMVVIKHSQTMRTRLEIAKNVLLENSKYLERLKEEAEKLAVTYFDRDNFEKMIREMYPTSQDNTELVKARNEAQIAHLLRAYDQDDLANFKNSAWRAVQAASDANSHPLNLRSTKVPAEFTNVMVAGMPLLNEIWDRVSELVVA